MSEPDPELLAARARIAELEDMQVNEELLAAARAALATLNLVAAPGDAFTDWPTNERGEAKARRASAQKAANRLRAALDGPATGE